MSEFLWFLLGLLAGSVIGAVVGSAIPTPLAGPFFRLADRIRGWLKFTPKA